MTNGVKIFSCIFVLFKDISKKDEAFLESFSPLVLRKIFEFEFLLLSTPQVSKSFPAKCVFFYRRHLDSYTQYEDLNYRFFISVTILA